MTVQPIRLFGDPVLRTAAEPVVDFDAELRGLVADLTDSMTDQNGAGLAAPQLGVGLRVFTFHVDDLLGHLVNPVLDFPDEEEQDGPEGCLSIPGLYFDTKRRQNVVAKGFNEYGDPVQIVGSGLLARCVQHETDHLDGVLFLDRLDPVTRKEAMRAIRQSDWYDEAAPPTIKVSPHRSSGSLFRPGGATSPFGLGR
ncbi:peptide deformylase [Solwaraspora sp. WMMD791]|uniref:peptide deformylase n=1 Tax=Solwaraspora sp. WMMD791 TaxID=3016086 RepID=UPI00249ABB86|nr:peptide deformylase [Solwaraspora sp. WMMD791]WFE28879.1 peptide deformylase [Solwaraspora sp. WMMD791]